MKSSVYGVFFKDIEKISIKNVHLIIKMFNVLGLDGRIKLIIR
jgi:hypothetical protein